MVCGGMGGISSGMGSGMGSGMVVCGGMGSGWCATTRIPPPVAPAPPLSSTHHGSGGSLAALVRGDGLLRLWETEGWVSEQARERAS